MKFKYCVNKGKVNIFATTKNALNEYFKTKISTADYFLCDCDATAMDYIDTNMKIGIKVNNTDLNIVSLINNITNDYNDKFNTLKDSIVSAKRTIDNGVRTILDHSNFVRQDQHENYFKLAQKILNKSADDLCKMI